MRVAETPGSVTSSCSVFTSRRIWTSDRFWVLKNDYLYFDQMVWSLSVARMDRMVKDQIYQFIASLYVKHDNPHNSPDI
jgi:hypothetical protein